MRNKEPIQIIIPEIRHIPNPNEKTQSDKTNAEVLRERVEDLLTKHPDDRPLITDSTPLSVNDITAENAAADSSMQMANQIYKNQFNAWLDSVLKLEQYNNKTAIAARAANLFKQRQTQSGFVAAQYLHDLKEVAKILAQLSLSPQANPKEIEYRTDLVFALYVGFIFHDQYQLIPEEWNLEEEEVLDVIEKQGFLEQRQRLITDFPSDEFEDIDADSIEDHLDCANDYLKDDALYETIEATPEQEDSRARENVEKFIQLVQERRQQRSAQHPESDIQKTPFTDQRDTENALAHHNHCINTSINQMAQRLTRQDEVSLDQLQKLHSVGISKERAFQKLLITGPKTERSNQQLAHNILSQHLLQSTRPTDTTHAQEHLDRLRIMLRLANHPRECQHYADALGTTCVVKPMPNQMQDQALWREESLEKIHNLTNKIMQHETHKMNILSDMDKSLTLTSKWKHLREVVSSDKQEPKKTDALSMFANAHRNTSLETARKNSKKMGRYSNQPSNSTNQFHRILKPNPPKFDAGE